jgi:Icc-related predicted phosphoesterase
LTRILHASDFHGSDVVFRKFLSAAKMHKADVIIIGGDITGKAMVPVIEQPDGSHQAYFFATNHVAKTKEDLKELLREISHVGFYPYPTDQREYEELKGDPKKLDVLFSKIMVERVTEWVRLAEQHLKNTKVKFYMMAGNDDIYEVDDAINSSDYVVNVEGKVVEVDEHHQMINTGHTNMTPWECPRDVAEEKLSEIIEHMTSQVSDMGRCIFNLHCPPFDTKLDQAPKLDKNMTYVHRGGQIEMVPVGSTAVREAIEKYQPMLGLHGHIHEARGFDKIGRTLLINGGSEYAEGICRAVIVNIDKDKVKGYLFISG